MEVERELMSFVLSGVFYATVMVAMAEKQQGTSWPAHFLRYLWLWFGLFVIYGGGTYWFETTYGEAVEEFLSNLFS